MRSCVSNLLLIAPLLGTITLVLAGGQSAQAATQAAAPAAATQAPTTQASPAADTAKAAVEASTPDTTNAKKPDVDAGGKTKSHKKPVDLLFSMRIRGGALSVDGMVAKVRLDYDLQDTEYMYFYLPGSGTAVVSRFKSPGSVLVANAFTDKSIEFQIGGHDFRLDSDTIAPGKTSHDLYVRFDTDRVAGDLGRYPQMGFGPVAQSPYAWPGALPEERSTADAHVKAPPVPGFMLPRRLSYAGTTAQ